MKKREKKLFLILIGIFILIVVLFQLTRVLINNNNLTGNQIIENQISLDNCQEINVSGTYVLSRNMVPTISQDSCFYISASDIQLDCNGYYISNPAITTIGIYAENVNNIIIKNCNISFKFDSGNDPMYYSYGIMLNNVANSVIEEIILTGNNVGIEIDQSSSNKIYMNALNYNAIGIALASSSNN